MDSQLPNTIWIESLFDVSKPYVYVIVLAPLVLFALGLRRLALMVFLGAAALFGILGAT